MSKRTKNAIARAARKTERGKPGKGKSKYALKQAITNRPGSPIREGA